MTTYRNSCEGGTEGVNVSTANSDDGTSGATLGMSPSGTSATVFRASSAIHGSMGHEATNAAGSAVYAQGALPAAAASSWAAYSFRIHGDLPASNTVIGAIRNAAGSALLVQVTTAGAVRLLAADAVTVIGTLGTVAADVDYRVEWGCTHGAATTAPFDGTARGRVWAEGSSVPSVTTYSNVNVGAADTINHRFGVQSGGAALILSRDSYAWGDGTTMLGAWTVAPVVSAGADQTVAQGASVSATATATDADGTIASYAWTCTEWPGAGAPTLTGAATATVSFTAADYGRYVLSVVATDNDGNPSEADTVTIYVPTTGEVLPVEDVNGTGVGTWTITGGSATHGAALSDSSDSTFVTAPDATASADTLRIPLRPSVVRSAPTLTVRVAKTTSAALTVDVRLYEGTTLRKTWAGITVTTSAADVALTLTTAEADAITDWNALAVEFSQVA